MVDFKWVGAAFENLFPQELDLGTYCVVSLAAGRIRNSYEEEIMQGCRIRFAICVGLCKCRRNRKGGGEGGREGEDNV